MRLWDILFLDLLPYYRCHAPKINRISARLPDEAGRQYGRICIWVVRI